MLPAANAPPSSNPAAQSLHYVAPFVDVPLIGGISILFFVALRVLQPAASTEHFLAAAAILTYLCNWPHFSATSYRLYHSKENIRQYPLTAVLVPVLVLLALAASFNSPSGFAPVFVKIFLIWSPYHFSGQTLGITLLYARRAGFRLGRVQRFVLASFIYSTFIWPTLRAEVGVRTLSFFGVAYPSLGLPMWAAHIAHAWMWLSLTAAAVIFLQLSLQTRRLVPLVVATPAVAQFVWFVPGSSVEAFYAYVPFFHGLQYLFIAWYVQLKETLSAKRSFRQYARTRTTLRWIAMNLAGGVILFWGLPRAASLVGQPLAFANAVVIAGVQIHHFMVDGVIWKLRNPAVQAPLSGCVQDMGLPRVNP